MKYGGRTLPHFTITVIKLISIRTTRSSSYHHDNDNNYDYDYNHHHIYILMQKRHISSTADTSTKYEYPTPKELLYIPQAFTFSGLKCEMVQKYVKE
jgi:hypothetical protein